MSKQSPTSTTSFINVRMQQNRTPTGRRTSTPAKKAALYYAFGREAQQQQAGRQQRGQWLGPDGKVCSHETVMDWVKVEAKTHRYTFQAVLSTPANELTPTAFVQAMQAAGQIQNWRLITHDDTQNRHAHVLWFGDKRLDKKQFLAWQAAVRAELVQQVEAQAGTQQATAETSWQTSLGLEPQHGLKREQQDEAKQAESRSRGVGLGW